MWIIGQSVERSSRSRPIGGEAPRGFLRTAVGAACAAAVLIFPLVLEAGAWSRTYATAVSAYGANVAPAADGGLFLAGSNYRDPPIVGVFKLDAEGRPVWDTGHAFAEGEGVAFLGVLATEDGGCVVGSSGRITYTGVRITFLDAQGLPYRETEFDVGTASYPSNFERTRDGGFAVTGSTYQGNQRRGWVMRFDAEGGLLWAKEYFERSHQWALAQIRPTADGGFLLSGTVPRKVGTAWFQDPVLVKLDAAGEVEWQRSYQGLVQGDWTQARGIQERPGGEFLVSYSSSNLGMIRVDSSGNPLSASAWSLSGDARIYSLTGGEDGSIVLAGSLRCGLG